MAISTGPWLIWASIDLHSNHFMAIRPERPSRSIRCMLRMRKAKDEGWNPVYRRWLHLAEQARSREGAFVLVACSLRRHAWLDRIAVGTLGASWRGLGDTSVGGRPLGLFRSSAALRPTTIGIGKAPVCHLHCVAACELGPLRPPWLPGLGPLARRDPVGRRWRRHSQPFATRDKARRPRL